MAEDKKENKNIIKYETDIIVNGSEFTITIDVDLATIDEDVFKEYLETQGLKVLEGEDYEEMEECFDLCKPLMDLFKKETYSKPKREQFIEFYTKWKV